MSETSHSTITPSLRSRICQRGTLIAVLCISSVMPYGAIISSEGG